MSTLHPSKPLLGLGSGWQITAVAAQLTWSSGRCIAVPQQRMIAAGGSQIFRVTTRTRPSAEEHAYRLIFEDVSELAAPATPSGESAISIRVMLASSPAWPPHATASAQTSMSSAWPAMRRSWRAGLAISCAARRGGFWLTW